MAALAKFVVSVMTVSILAYVLLHFVFWVGIVNTSAMSPSVKAGDLLICDRTAKTYSIDEVVTYTHADVTYYGRIVAQSGDVVDIDSSGYISINGNILSRGVTPAVGGIDYPFTVSEGCYFIVCDNYLNNVDSRVLGEISTEEIKGKVMTLLRKSNF